MTRKEGYNLIQMDSWGGWSFPESPYVSPTLLHKPPKGINDMHVVSLFLLVNWQMWKYPNAEEEENGWVVFPKVGEEATKHRMGGSMLSAIRAHCKDLEKSELLKVKYDLADRPLLFKVNYGKVGEEMLAAFPSWREKQLDDHMAELEKFDFPDGARTGRTRD